MRIGYGLPEGLELASFNPQVVGSMPTPVIGSTINSPNALCSWGRVTGSLTRFGALGARRVGTGFTPPETGTGAELLLSEPSPNWPP